MTNGSLIKAKVLQIAPLEHSAILFAPELSDNWCFLEWLFYTGFTVHKVWLKIKIDAELKSSSFAGVVTMGVYEKSHVIAHMS